MSILKQNTNDLWSILEAVNELSALETCSITFKTEGAVLLRMFTAPVLTDTGIDIVLGSNMTAGLESNFTVPVTIDNVIVGGGVNFMFSGAILSGTKVEGDVIITPLGTDYYVAKPMGNCTITCYDRD